jgi:hypothetical protein
MTMNLIWHPVRTAFVEVNGGEGEDITSMLACIFPQSARTMLAQGSLPFADRNGRDGALPTAKPSNLDLEKALKIITDLKGQLSAKDNMIAQTKNANEKHKAARHAETPG